MYPSLMSEPPSEECPFFELLIEDVVVSNRWSVAREIVITRGDSEQSEHNYIQHVLLLFVSSASDNIVHIFLFQRKRFQHYWSLRYSTLCL